MFDPSSLEIHMMLNADLEDAILDSSAILSSADVLSVYILSKRVICLWQGTQEQVQKLYSDQLNSPYHMPCFL